MRQFIYYLYTFLFCLQFVWGLAPESRFNDKPESHKAANEISFYNLTDAEIKQIEQIAEFNKLTPEQVEEIKKRVQEIETQIRKTRGRSFFKSLTVVEIRFVLLA